MPSLRPARVTTINKFSRIPMKRFFPFLALASALFFGCASTPKAPLNPQGGKYAVQVYVDGGWDQIDTANPNQKSQRNQLVSYLKSETLKRLNASGYAATGIESASAYNPEGGARMLKVKVDMYNAGSAAARMLVGLGAGAAQLDSHAEYLDKGKSLFNLPNSIASGRDWRKIVTKTDILILREMAKYP